MLACVNARREVIEKVSLQTSSGENIKKNGNIDMYKMPKILGSVVKPSLQDETASYRVGRK